MRIVFIGPQIYDYMASSIIEGLTELGHELICSETSNGGVGASDAEVLYALDPTHYAHFTMDSFRAMVSEIGGLSVDLVAACVPNWSFRAIMTKAEA